MLPARAPPRSARRNIRAVSGASWSGRGPRSEMIAPHERTRGERRRTSAHLSFLRRHRSPRRDFERPRLGFRVREPRLRRLRRRSCGGLNLRIFSQDRADPSGRTPPARQRQHARERMPDDAADALRAGRYARRPHRRRASCGCRATVPTGTSALLVEPLEPEPNEGCELWVVQVSSQPVGTRRDRHLFFAIGVTDEHMPGRDC